MPRKRHVSRNVAPVLFSICSRTVMPRKRHVSRNFNERIKFRNNDVMPRKRHVSRNYNQPKLLCLVRGMWVETHPRRGCGKSKNVMPRKRHVSRNPFYFKIFSICFNVMPRKRHVSRNRSVTQRCISCHVMPRKRHVSRNEKAGRIVWRVVQSCLVRGMWVETLYTMSLFLPL